MTRLQALAAGLLVGRLPGVERRATVYERAVNFTGPDGLVLSLVARPQAMTAHSLLVPELFRRRPEDLEGRAGWRREGRFVVAGEVEIDFGASPPWSGRPPEGAGRGFDPERLARLREVVRRGGRPGGLLGLLEPEADNAFCRRAAAVLRALPAAGPQRGLERLVGLGPGLTPSGDDFLTGALLAEALGGGPAARAGRGSGAGRGAIDRDGLRAALPKTTPPGRNLLWLALEGHFPAYLLDLARAVDEDSPAAPLEAAVPATLGHGETSGTDSSVGLLWLMAGFRPV